MSVSGRYPDDRPADLPSNDVATARAYGRSVPNEFGGVHLSGDLLLVLFTDRVSFHAQEIARRVKRADRMLVRPCALSWRDLSASMLQVKARLAPHADLGVREIGFGLRRGVLVVRIQLRTVTPEIVRQLREAVEPEEIYIDPIGRVDSVYMG